VPIAVTLNSDDPSSRSVCTVRENTCHMPQEVHGCAFSPVFTAVSSAVMNTARVNERPCAFLTTLKRSFTGLEKHCRAMLFETRVGHGRATRVV